MHFSMHPSKQKAVVSFQNYDLENGNIEKAEEEQQTVLST